LSIRARIGNSIEDTSGEEMPEDERKVRADTLREHGKRKTVPLLQED
jgi:hypothetical protein